MITPAHLRDGDVFTLLRTLGYDIAPITIAAADWRRAGIEIAWNGNGKKTFATKKAHCPTDEQVMK